MFPIYSQSSLKHIHVRAHSGGRGNCYMYMLPAPSSDLGVTNPVLNT